MPTVAGRCWRSSGTAWATPAATTWAASHCQVGALCGSWGISDISPVLHLGVGDGTSLDPGDWALFMLQVGSTGGDFHQDTAYALGCKGRTSAAFAGRVTIAAEVFTTTTTTAIVSLAEPTGGVLLYIGQGSTV